VVFWGINGLPLKYGLVDNLDTPGRNVTGVWQQGYHKESLDLLKRLVPKASTFAILACDSESSRPNVKMIEQLAQRGVLPLKLVDKVLTNSLDEFKSRTLKVSREVDAFFVLNHDTLRDAGGSHVDMLDVGRWYLQTIRKPEASHEDQFVLEGMLLTANDSGYNQGFLAFEMAHGILERGLNPARMAVRTPERGPYLVNRNRARQLGIALEDAMYLIDEVVDKSIALGIT
jgi:putative ABC transport system substrate-binding protein